MIETFHSYNEELEYVSDEVNSYWFETHHETTEIIDYGIEPKKIETITNSVSNLENLIRERLSDDTYVDNIYGDHVKKDGQNSGWFRPDFYDEPQYYFKRKELLL